MLLKKYYWVRNCKNNQTRILVFSKDNDIIPALKCARINGLNVFIAHITGGFKIANKLRLHSDGIREIGLSNYDLIFADKIAVAIFNPADIIHPK